jgi:hypothetical protein
MKIIDVHPDDLLDREIEGTLSVDERRRLREHLARCTQCRLERQLRSDFEAELSADDDAREIQSFVSGALRAVRSPALPRAVRKSAHAWRRRLVFVLAATMVFATGLAAAQVEITGRAFSAAREKIAFFFHLPSPEPPTAVAAKSVPAEQASVGQAANAPAVDAPSAAEAVVDVAVPAALEAPSPRPAVHRAPAEPTFVAAPTLGPVPVPSSEAPKSRDSASAVFDDASAARRRGNWVEATELYRDLQVRFPASPEARLSIAVVARMQLDLGETGAAASGFAAYLATGDRALREEAMAGRAIALGRLGRAREEDTAWRDLLVAYPSSGYASLARTRLRQDTP